MSAGYDPQAAVAAAVEKLAIDPLAGPWTVYCAAGGLEVMLACFSLRGDVPVHALFCRPVNELWTREAALAQAHEGRTEPSIRVVELPAVVGIKNDVLGALTGVGDELFPLAARRVDEDMVDDVDMAALNFEHEVDEAYLEWATTPEDKVAEKRAAVLRLAAASVAFLAVDEVHRGAAVVALETARLDGNGRLLS